MGGGVPLEGAAAAWVTRPLRPFGPPPPEGEDLFWGGRWRACPGLGLDPRLRGDERWRVGGRPEAGAGLVSEAWVAGLRRRGAAAAWVTRPLRPFGPPPPEGEDLFWGGRWRACPGLGLDPRLRGDERWRVGGRPEAGAGLVSEAWVAGLRRRGAAAAWVEAASGPSGHLSRRGRSCLAAGRAVRTAPRATAEPAGGAGRRTR